MTAQLRSELLKQRTTRANLVLLAWMVGLVVVVVALHVLSFSVGALAGAGIGLLAETLTAGAEAVGLAARGIHVELSSGDYAQLLAGGALAAALFAAIGVGVGTVVRNQVASLVGLCVWLLFL